MILIVGASGFLGRETAKELLARGEQVRALTRTAAKLDDLKALGADVMIGDLIDPPSLARACQGADAVVAAAHALTGRGKYRSERVDDAGHRALIDAARVAGVRHFVYTSILGAGPDHAIDFYRTKYRIEEYLKASGLSYTILRPSAFMEWHVHLLNGKSILDSGKTTILGTGTKARNFIAAGDVAQFAVMALNDPAYRNRTIELGGIQNLNNNQVAELYGALLGIAPSIRHIPTLAARMLSAALKPVHPGLSRVMRMAILPESVYNETFDASELLHEFPVLLTTVEEFIGERIAERIQRPLAVS